MTRQRPLWTCPKCGNKFVTANMWHSCGRYRLSDHFEGRPKVVKRTYDAWIRTARQSGPVRVIPQKSRIAFQVKVRFAGAIVRKNWLEASLWLTHKVNHPLLHKTTKFGPGSYGHAFRLERPEDIDDQLKGLMAEAYRVGLREHLK